MSRATHAAASPVLRYFSSIGAALDGLDVFLRDDNSPLYQHELVARTVVPYLARLAASFDSWRNRLDFSDKFRISRADSGFPVYQNVLELEKDRRSAESRLDAIPDPETLRADMADFILRHKAFPKELQDRLAERLRGLISHVNLIPMNPWDGSGFQSSTEEQIQTFYDILESRGVDVSVRRSRGKDAGAACGQLALKRPGAVSGAVSSAASGVGSGAGAA